MSSTSRSWPWRRACSISSRHASIASTYLVVSATCDPTWNERPRTRMPRLRASSSIGLHGRGLAAELPRQVDDCGRITERQPQQQLRAAAIGGELAHLVRVVGDEQPDAEAQRGHDVPVVLDRVSVDAAVRRHALRPDQVDLARGRDVERCTEVAQRRHDGSDRQRLQRVMQPDARKRGRERTILLADRSRSRRRPAASRDVVRACGSPPDPAAEMRAGRNVTRPFRHDDRARGSRQQGPAMATG